MGIRVEFEKDWKAQIIQATDRDRKVAWAASLWAAKWMGEKCEKEVLLFIDTDWPNDDISRTVKDIAKSISQLIKQLDTPTGS